VMANVPGLGSPARPAWRPMALQPRTPKGITVLGTTLTRRQTVIAGAIVLALILLIVFVIVPRAFGGDPKAAEPPAGAVPQTSAQPTPKSEQPSSTKPSSAAPTATKSTGVTLPAGWYVYKDQTGFSVPVPKGWSVRRQGTEVYFQESGGQYRLLIVDQTNSPKPDPRADWQNQESQRRGSYRNYHRIGINIVSYWDKAADWEFTRTSDNGNPLHVVKRGFITAPDLAYGITWSTSAGDWNANKANLNLIYQGFVPARS
jgi:hypothetical protein